MYPPSSENYVSNVDFSFDWSFQGTELPPGVSQSDYAPPLPNAPPPCLPISTSFHHGQQSFCQQPKQQKTSRGKYNKHKRGSSKNWTVSKRLHNVYGHDESSASGSLNVNYLASPQMSSVNSVPLPWHTSNAPERTPPWRSHISTSLDGTENCKSHEEFGTCQEYFRVPFTSESSSINNNHQFSRHYMSQYGYQSTHRTASQYDLQRSFNISSSQIVIQKPAAPSISNTKNSQERIVKVDDTKKKIAKKTVNSDKKQPVLVFPRSKKPKAEETKKHNQNKVICQANVNDEPLNPRTGVNAGLQLFKKKTNSKKIEFKLVSSIGLSKLNIDRCRTRESRVQDDYLEVSVKKIKLDTNKSTDAMQAVQSTTSQEDKEDNVCYNLVEPLKPTTDETQDDVNKIKYDDSIFHNESSLHHDSESGCKKMNIDSDIVIEPCQTAHENVPITGNEKGNVDANSASELTLDNDLNIMAVDLQLGHTELIVDDKKETEHDSFDAQSITDKSIKSVDNSMRVDFTSDIDYKKQKNISDNENSKQFSSPEYISEKNDTTTIETTMETKEIQHKQMVISDKGIPEIEESFDKDNANYKIGNFSEKFNKLKKPQDSTDTEGLRSDDSIKPLLSKQKRVVKKLLNVTSKKRDPPKSQPRSRQSYVRKQEKISQPNTKDAKANKCESCGDKSKDLETIGALELCSTCVPLFTSQVARAKTFPHNFKLNQKVEVLNIDKVWYPAKIVIVEKAQVKVHFDGWEKEFDEWISVDSRRLRAHTAENNLDCLSKPTKKDSSDIQIASTDLQKDPKSENSESLSSCPDTDSESDAGYSSNSPESELTTLSDESDSEYNNVSNSNNINSARLRRRAGYRKNVTLSRQSVPEPKSSSQPKESLCESCKIMHLNVQRVGSLDLCSYCRTLFDDDNTIRFRRAGQYGFQPHKRVKILCRDNEWYAATQVDVVNGRIRVHFDGWSDKFDEWIPAGSQRMKDMTLDEILEAQKALEDGSTEVFDENESMLIPHNKSRIRVKGQNKSSSVSSSSKKSSSQSKNVQSKKRDYQYDGDSDIRSQQSESTDSLASFDLNDFYIGRNTRRSIRNDKLLSNSNILSQLKARFKPGNQIEVRDRLREWVPATIVESKGCRVLIHYDDVPAFYDEWIDISSERLRMKPVKSNETCVVTQDNKDRQKKDDRKKKNKLDTVDDSLEFIDIGALPSDMTGSYLIKPCNTKTQLVIICFAFDINSEAKMFPSYHEHPRCSFACQSVIDDEAIKMSSKGEVIKTFDKDIFDTTYKDPGIDLVNENVQLDSGMGYLYLQAWNSRKICGFCNDDDGQQLGGFIGPQPFVTNTYTRHGERQKIFWAHDACAKYSPEVFVSKSNEWYNVTLAWKRGRSMKCGKCKERGATIGCFEPKCTKSFHLPCTDKPLSHFEMGVIFYCPTHESRYLKKEMYNEIYRCDVCSCELQADKWWTCKPCESNFFSSFDLCPQCFTEKFPETHEHNKEDFDETSVKQIKDQQITKQTEMALASQKARESGMRKKSKNYPPNHGKGQLQCSYCWADESPRWRKGYDGVLMCEDCFELVLVNNTTGESHLETNKLMVTSEDYSYRPYLTRNSCSDKKFDYSESQTIYLDTYEPAENQLFSLPFDSSYFDIPGRAPRWATHSGTDYHGTWLPQTVRRYNLDELIALLRFTKKNDRVMSNFLGRGTDAIESFLLCRRLVGVDINPAAVALSQRNCSFAIPPDRGITAEHRPIILQADSRHLTGTIFEDESFDHVLSHPPYKNCVEYSTHIDGDLSRYANSKEFAIEMSKVIEESWRLLKPGKRVTLGIGDNREHCFYVPVSFNLFRQYIDQGFELEELVAKRQRYCQAFGLGTYLCVQYDFLMFTHEFIATFKKVDKEKNDLMLSMPDDSELDEYVTYSSNLREIPILPIARKSVVMGTTWTFKPTSKHSFVQLCASRMVERFGRDYANYEEISIEFKNIEFNNNSTYESKEQINKEGNESDDDIPEYERIRQKQIQENQKMLLSLGLKCDLGEESDDISHLEKLLNSKPLPPPTPTALIVIPHISNNNLNSQAIPYYRATIKRLAREAYDRLPPSGFLVIGGQDVRTSDNKLWPLSMLFMEDVNNAVGEDKMPLKELVITVPDGYAKDKKKICSYEDYTEERCVVDDEESAEQLSIVHVNFL
ncbi:43912_t:CDS:10 [Gigaspora margarita]|uniref:43912_t:CDS:1 n=1 Tax=Gigaspora margarita TaxID=4874 RepID=A0ABM8VZ64_GIGMA|nr:43912_t:CDS:10 [Gigaspora margarita]